MTTLKCAKQHIERTIALLKEGGARNVETVVLWFAPTNSEIFEVSQVYRPEQCAARDRFHIPQTSMRQLMQELRRERSKIVAQVHSHPFEAFHSKADDVWAIIRHVGAISLVLPYCARTTDVANFTQQVAAYRLSPTNHWEEAGINTLVEIA